MIELYLVPGVVGQSPFDLLIVRLFDDFPSVTTTALVPKRLDGRVWIAYKVLLRCGTVEKRSCASIHLLSDWGQGVSSKTNTRQIRLELIIGKGDMKRHCWTRNYFFYKILDTVDLPGHQHGMVITSR